MLQESARVVRDRLRPATQSSWEASNVGTKDGVLLFACDRTDESSWVVGTDAMYGGKSTAK